MRVQPLHRLEGYRSGNGKRYQNSSELIFRIVISLILIFILDLIVFFITYAVRLVISQTHFVILQLAILMDDIIRAGSALFEQLINMRGSIVPESSVLLEGDLCALFVLDLS